MQGTWAKIDERDDVMQYTSCCDALRLELPAHVVEWHEGAGFRATFSDSIVDDSRQDVVQLHGHIMARDGDFSLVSNGGLLMRVPTRMLSRSVRGALVVTTMRVDARA